MVWYPYHPITVLLIAACVCLCPTHCGVFAASVPVQHELELESQRRQVFSPQDPVVVNNVEVTCHVAYLQLALAKRCHGRQSHEGCDRGVRSRADKCMHACKNESTNARTYKGTHTCTHKQTHAQTHAQAHACMQTHIHTHTHINKCMRRYTNACTHILRHTVTQTHACTIKCTYSHTNTNTQTNTHT